MNKDNNWFMRQFDMAREEMQRAAKQQPFMFPEYLRLSRAKDALKAAQKEFDAAQAAWNRRIGE